MNDYVLCINKETGMTSHDVINKLRKILGIRRIGHTGTLDPLASGVLVVCVGEATKLVQFLETNTKEYECEIVIGKETDTYDSTGKILKEEKVEFLDEVKVDDVLKSFIGKSKQLPPMYSAIKVNGKKLYEYARKNIEIQVEERDIEIFDIKRISNIKYDNNCAIFKFIVNVSKGTYIRSLCMDIANKLGYPGMMNNLIRTKVEDISLDDCSKLEDIELGNFKKISMLEILKNYPKIDDEFFVKKGLNGMKISFNNILDSFGSLIEKFVIYQNDSLVAIYEKDDEKHCYKAVRVWN